MKIFSIINLIILTVDLILCLRIINYEKREKSQLEKALIEENKRLKEENFKLKYNVK